MPKQPSIKSLNEQIAAWREEAIKRNNQSVLYEQQLAEANQDNERLRDTIKQNDRHIATLHRQLEEQFSVINIYREICGLQPNDRPLW